MRIISFTLYPAWSRVSWVILVLRHSASHFPLISDGIPCWVAELNATLLPWQQSEEIKILNISLPRVTIEPTTLRVYSHKILHLFIIFVFKYNINKIIQIPLRPNFWYIFQINTHLYKIYLNFRVQQYTESGERHSHLQY